MSGLAGYLMRVAKSGPTNFKVERCRSRLYTQLVETTPSEDSGKETFIPGVSGGDLDIDIVYVISDAPYAALANGGSYSVTFYPDKGTAGSNIAGTLVVGECTFAGEVKGKQTLHVTGKFTGGATPTAV